MSIILEAVFKMQRSDQQVLRTLVAARAAVDAKADEDLSRDLWTHAHGQNSMEKKIYLGLHWISTTGTATRFHESSVDHVSFYKRQ